MVTRHEDVAAIFKDPRFSTNFSQAYGEMCQGLLGWRPQALRVLGNQMVTQDDPNHARLKALVHKAFTPKRIQDLEQRVEHITTDLIENIAKRDVIDIVEDFALPLPMTVISEMLGVPEDQRDDFRRYMTNMLDIPSFGLLTIIKNIRNTLGLIRYLKNLIQLRRKEPDDGLITALIEAEQEGDHLSEEELIGMVFVLLLAGHETTVNLIANGTLALLEHPDQWRMLRENRKLMPTAIEEFLRFTNPVEHGVIRFATEDLPVAGVIIPKGSVVMAMLSSANRDETVFDNPDELDVSRTPNRHLAFGVGMHYCLGAPLARMEGSIAFNALLDRFPDMQLTVLPKAVRWRPSIAGFRGLVELPVRLYRHAAAA